MCWALAHFRIHVAEEMPQNSFLALFTRVLNKNTFHGLFILCLKEFQLKSLCKLF